jgi:cytochrome c biogenesis protein CcmG/thiol:disulfide interchange protein DsbE
VSGAEPKVVPPTARRGIRAALVALVLALTAAGLVWGVRGPSAPQAVAGPAPAPTEDAGEVGRLQARAALAPCPAGLGPQLPDLTLPCLGGGPAVRLRAAVPGRPTLVNVWASWCPPCVDEVPALEAFSAKAGARVGLVGVLTTDTRRSALTFAAQLGMRWPSVVDDDGRVLRANLPGPPVTLFLDADGRVVFRKSGAFASEAQLEDLVAQHLGVRL